MQPFTPPPLRPETGKVPSFADQKRRTLTSRKEALAVMLTGVAHLVCENVFNAKWIFMVVACAAWGGYLVRQVRRERTLLQQWGFHWRNLGVSSMVAAGVFLFGAAGIAGVAHSRGMLAMHWHLLPLFFVYPIWGPLQQFLLRALIVRNLAEGVPWLRSSWRVTPIAAVLFAGAHWPDTLLMGATFLLGLVFTPI
jgi:hypothetical protein